MRSPASGRASVSHLAQFIIVACLCTSLLNASPLPVGTPLSTPSSHGSQPQSLSQFSKRMELAAAHGTEAASIVTHNSAETANTAKSHSNTPNLKVLHASSSGVDSAEDSQAVDSTTAGLSKIGTAPEQSQPPTKEALASDTKDVDVGPEAAAADNGLTTTAEPHKPAEADKIANEKPAGQVVEAPVTAPESSLLTTPDQNAAKPAEGEKIASEKPAGEVVEAPTTVNSEPESSPPTTSDQNAVKPATDDTSSRTPTTTADPKGAATPASADATTSAALQASSSGNDGKTVDGTAGVSNVDATLHPDLIRTEKSGSQDGPGEDPTGLAYYPVDFFRLGRIANTNPAGRSGVARPLKYSASTGTASEKSGSQDGLDLFEDLMSLDHDPAQLPREVMEYLELVLPGFKSAARSKLAGQPKNSASAPSGSDQLRADAAATTFDNAHDLAPNVAPEASHVKTGTASEKSGSQDGLVDDPISLDHDSVKILRGVKNYLDAVLELVSPRSKWAGRSNLARQPEDSASAGPDAAATTFDNVHGLAPDVVPEASHVETSTASEKSGSQDGLVDDTMSLDHDSAQFRRDVKNYVDLVLKSVSPRSKWAGRSNLARQPEDSASAGPDAAATTFDNVHGLAPDVAPEASHVETSIASEKSGSQDGLVDDPMSLDHDSVKFLRGVKNYVDLVLESVSPQSKWAGRPKLAGQPEDSASAGSVSDQPRSNAAATTFDNVHDLAPDVAPEASHVETDSLKLEQDASSETKKRKIKLNPIPETREFKPDSAIERDWDTFQSEGENKQAVLKASGAPPPRGILKKNGLSHVVATPTKAAEPMTTTPATQAASDASRVNADPVTEVNPANTLESSGSPPPPGIHNQDGTSHVVALPSEAAEPITATPATQAASDASRVNPDPVTEVNSANTLDSAGSPPHPGIQNQPPKEADKNLDPIVTVKSVNPDPATGKFPASTTPKEAPKPITTTPAAQEASDASRFKPDSAGTPSMFKKINLKKYLTKAWWTKFWRKITGFRRSRSATKVRPEVGPEAVKPAA
ncbi:hypothetical protein PtA15_3A327 [Puccinia triticina]|uniref:Uncharacterized protein n=1 Tax=Puccinia triticina TaxID=208348 RepID=A0ABY7CFN6_9BASI|nr:uncharacterized protein PtA15_3A327 [Puccinia triticina]WAQ82961.1 hypothetical protein PtA15_3A327 [Puccinia triticina]